jgi:hypothetical protein
MNLTICLLTKGREIYLNRTLISFEKLFKFSFINFLIYDNGSDSNCELILREWSNKNSSRVKYIRVEQNDSRFSISWEIIKNTVDDWIIFPGDDDVFCKTAIDKMLSTLSGMAEDVSLVAARAQVIDQNGVRLNISYKPKKYASQADLLATLIDKSVLWFPATAIKTDILKDNFLPNSLTAFDWYVWILACTQGKIELTEAEIIKYRKHTDKEQNSFLEENWKIDELLMFSYAVNKGAISEWIRASDFQVIQEFVKQLAKNSAIGNFSFQDKMKYIMLFQEINKSFELNILLEDVKLNFIEEMDPRFKQSLLGLSTSIDNFKSLFLNVGIDFDFNSKPKQKSNFITVISNQNGFDSIKNYLGNESTTKIIKDDNLIVHLFDEYNDILRIQREAEVNKQITKFEMKVIKIIRSIKQLKNRRPIFNR